MLKKSLLVLVLLVAVLLIVVMLQPSDYKVERSKVINASSEMVWAQISDFNKWKAWSHWEKSDPTQKTTITGEPGKVGHTTQWVGEKTGEGTMAITSADAPSQLDIKLGFIKPMASEATTRFVVVPEGEGVKVTWSMDGKNDFVGKFFSLVMNVEGMVGSAYEDSLTNMKAIVESQLLR